MMSKIIIKLSVLFILLCQFMVIIPTTAAQNIEDLVSRDKLTINLKVNQQEQHIVGQALVLAVEVSTDRWFATGSQIQHFNLKNVVMQANNITTINGSKRINGKTWAIQTHEITLFPTKSGIYQIPEIKVDVSINTENDGIINGVLSTKTSHFNIELPEALRGITNFIVSSQVTLSIDGQFDEEKEYMVGEAITQTITITATDTPAMMIAPINLTNNVVNNEASLAGSSGLSIYHKPVQLFDQSNRGTLLGTRVESYTYIFEQPGSYVIDEQIIYWWNSQTNSLEELTIPSSRWSVLGGAISQVDKSSHLATLKFNVETVITLTLAMLILILFYLGYIKRHHLSALYNRLTKRKKRVIRRKFLNCVIENKYLPANQFLYQYSLLSNRPTDIINFPLAKKLNQLAFDADNANNTTLNLSISEAKALIKQIDTDAKTQKKYANFSAHQRIKLNIE